MESTMVQPAWQNVAEVELSYKSKIKASERPRITQSKDAADLLTNLWNKDKIEFVEEFKVLLLNRANRVLGMVEVSSGGVTGTVADPKLVLVAAIKANVLNGDGGEGVFGNYESYPIKNLVQAYLKKDGSFYSSQPDYEQNEFVQEFQNRDPRLTQTYAYPGWELVRSGTYSQGAGLYVQQLAKSFSGYHQIKGFYNYTNQDDRNNIEVPLYRFAETLLIYAEAKAELGQITQADLDITVNRLRDRVAMPHLFLDAVIDPVEAEKFPNVNGSLTGLIYEIRRERRVELAFEGFRSDDLVRWEAGKYFKKEPQGIYFASLGKKDLTGDGIPDIYLLPSSESIPANKETNSLGKTLQYYRVGTFGQEVSVFLGGDNSGNVQIIEDAGSFISPKYYYRSIPKTQVTLNPNLKQIFGWE